MLANAPSDVRHKMLFVMKKKMWETTPLKASEHVLRKYDSHSYTFGHIMERNDTKLNPVGKPYK